MKQELVTIIVVPRDRFSTLRRCLDALLAHTPACHKIMAVLGGAPASLRSGLERDYHGRVTFRFPESFQNGAQSRNAGLRLAQTRLSICIESDTFVRAGWLEPLVACQQETNAAMVAPLILESPRKIHTAGNDLYITYENGRTYAHKELRYYGMIYGESCNLARRSCDYVEMHCHLVETKTALKLKIFDETLSDMHECDAGLILSGNGRKMMFEPASVVQFHLVDRITDPRDIALFCWRWDMREQLKGYRAFESKWGMDITEHGNMRNWLLNFNNKVGWVSRFFHTRLALWLDRKALQLANLLLRPVRMVEAGWLRYKARRLGFYEWPVSPTKWFQGL